MLHKTKKEKRKRSLWQLMTNDLNYRVVKCQLIQSLRHKWMSLNCCTMQNGYFLAFSMIFFYTFLLCSIRTKHISWVKSRVSTIRVPLSFNQVRFSLLFFRFVSLLFSDFIWLSGPCFALVLFLSLLSSSFFFVFLEHETWALKTWGMFGTST